MRFPSVRTWVLTAAALELVLALLLGYAFREAREALRQAALASFRANLVVNRVAAELARAEVPRLPRKATMLFVGDVMLARGVEHYAVREGGGDWAFPFARVSSTLRAADLTIGNLEHPASDRGRNQGSAYSLRASPDSIAGLADAGFDVVSLANNHIWDWGPDALADTLAHLEAAGVRHVGAGMKEVDANRPLVVEAEGQSIAFLAWTNLYPEGLEARGENPGVSRFREAEASARIKTLAATHDIVVVLFHWGDEYQTRANATQQRIARTLAAAGADLIIGHHPHVAQEMEQIGDAWAFYSLGNFVFDQGFSEETMRGLAARVTIEGGKVAGVELLPVSMNQHFQPAFEGLQ